MSMRRADRAATRRLAIMLLGLACGVASAATLAIVSDPRAISVVA